MHKVRMVSLSEKGPPLNTTERSLLTESWGAPAMAVPHAVANTRAENFMVMEDVVGRG